MTTKVRKPDEPQDGELTESRDMLKKLESQGGNVKVVRDEQIDSKKKIDSEERFLEHIRTGHVSSVLFICTVFVLAVGGILFMSPMILMVNNKEQLVNDLNDGLYAYHMYSRKVLGGQLGGNCNEETIQCKFKTMSPMLKERFERYGFKLSANKAENDRYRVSAMMIPGGGAAFNAASLDAARKNRETDALVDKVYSSRTSVYQDRQFYHLLLRKYGLHQANTLSGETRKEFGESFDDRVKNGDNMRYQNDDIDPNQAANSGTETEGDTDKLDKNGRGVYSLGSLSTMTDTWRNDIYTNLVDKANTHLSLACAFATYGNLAENALMRAKVVTITRYAMNYLAVADDMKSGTMNNGGEIAVEVLADNLMKANGKKQNAMDADSYRAPALGESVKDTGSILKQLSPLLQLGVIKIGGPSMPGSEYLKGALTAGGGVVQNSAREKTPDGLCAEGMAGAQSGSEQGRLCWSPASYPLAQYIGAYAGGVVAGAKDAIEKFLCPVGVKVVLDAIVKNATRPEVTMTLPLKLQMTAQTEARNFTSTISGVEAQNIIFAGTGQLLGDRAQALGMRPASVASLTTYLKSAESARIEYENANRELARATPWDASNPYSFAGTVVASLMPAGATLPTHSWRSSAATLLSALPVSAAKIAESSAGALYTQPMHFQPARLLPTNTVACGLPAEFTALITPDFACNIRYSMSQDELNLEISNILDYMTKPHPDNARESLQDVQKRDTNADSARGGKMKQQAEEGANAAYIDKKTGKPNKYTEYAKFLEYCTDRYDPWGNVGMSVELKDLPEEDEDQGSSGGGGSPWNDPAQEKNYANGRNEEGGNTLLQPREVEDSYYALGWGSKQDQDWYTGKKCAEESEMMKYFRGYTMACGVLASMSGTANCWERDTIANGHDDFYLGNNVLFESTSPVVN